MGTAIYSFSWNQNIISVGDTCSTGTTSESELRPTCMKTATPTKCSNSMPVLRVSGRIQDSYLSREVVQYLVQQMYV